MPNPMNEIFDHEDMRLELGRLIWTKYMGPNVLDYPAGTNFQDLCTAWLEAMGFTSALWAQAADDCLLLYLWYQEGKEVKYFILAFEGLNADHLTVFDPVKSGEAA